MRFSRSYLAAALLAFGTSAQATVFTFDTDPFAGSTALTTPGRQVVGGESFVSFDIANDVFVFDSTVFGVANQVLFVNDVVANLPGGGVNIIVLQSFDNDSDPATPFGAGTAANLIATQLTTSGAGFFIYFNQGLDLPRLVYSTDLDDATADLKILARMTNLNGQAGRDAFPSFTVGNFDMITDNNATLPEPSTLMLIAASAAWWAGGALRRQNRARRSATA